ncbi:UNVERIFIED_CONTAM: hypothetical protein RMT77_014525 [Armadillidium vulgare]
MASDNVFENPAFDKQEEIANTSEDSKDKIPSNTLEEVIIDNDASKIDKSAKKVTSENVDQKVVDKTTNFVEKQKSSEITYGIDDVPPWQTCFVLGLQHYLIMVGSTISIPFVLAPLLCIADEDPARGKLVSSIIFVSGIVTLLQTSVGVRLPIIQGGTFSFLLPAIAILTSSFPPCSDFNIANMTQPERDEVWMTRMREIQGAIIVSSLFQVIIGFTGAIGLLISVITPLTIVPTITLIGLSLFKTATEHSAGHWGISSLTVILIIVFSQYLKNMGLPVPYISKREVTWTKFRIFMYFPVILSMMIAWAICGILTSLDAIPADSKARTDTKLSLISDSPWFYVPYPFQWGIPTVSVSGVLGMLSGVIASMIESVGDYYACARLSDVESPPKHAFNRGIGVEGIGCVIAGLIGSGNGTTSYSGNIGAIRVTKVASRRVIQVSAILMLICGVIGKFGAVFITLPDPVIGGLSLVIFAFVTSVGLSNLQSVDLNSSRNLFVLGISLFFGLAIPEWVTQNSDTIATGYATLDQLLKVLLQTQMFVGGILGLFLDNTIPGSDEERGISKGHAVGSLETPERNEGDLTSPSGGSCYDLPVGMDFIKRNKWCSKIPFIPTYEGSTSPMLPHLRSYFRTKFLRKTS